MTDNKILYVANVTQHIIRFHLPYLQHFQKKGYQVHVAANGQDEISHCDIIFRIPVQRKLFSFKNIQAFFALRRIIRKNNYRLIVCNTSLASLLTRLAAISARKNGTKVVFFAHGLLYGKNTSLKSWVLYYPIDRLLAMFTDVFITINNEDHKLLKNLYHEKVYKINGVGINPEKFQTVDSALKSKYRKELGYDDKEFLLVYTAEFIHRKNHRFILDSLKEFVQKIENLKIIFPGRGILLEQMKNYAREKDIDKYVDFMGFRTDIPRILALADVGVSTSKNEGLPLNIVEDMCMSLPIVASRDKGHEELVQHGINGYLFDQGNQRQFINYICKLAESQELRKEMGIKSHEFAQKFTISKTLVQFFEILDPFLKS